MKGLNFTVFLLSLAYILITCIWAGLFCFKAFVPVFCIYFEACIPNLVLVRLSMLGKVFSR